MPLTATTSSPATAHPDGLGTNDHVLKHVATWLHKADKVRLARVNHHIHAVMEQLFTGPARVKDRIRWTRSLTQLHDRCAEIAALPKPWHAVLHERLFQCVTTQWKILDDEAIVILAPFRPTVAADTRVQHAGGRPAFVADILALPPNDCSRALAACVSDSKGSVLAEMPLRRWLAIADDSPNEQDAIALLAAIGTYTSAPDPASGTRWLETHDCLFKRQQALASRGERAYALRTKLLCAVALGLDEAEPGDLLGVTVSDRRARWDALLQCASELPAQPCAEVLIALGHSVRMDAAHPLPETSMPRWRSLADLAAARLRPADTARVLLGMVAHVVEPEERCAIADSGMASYLADSAVRLDASLCVDLCNHLLAIADQGERLESVWPTVFRLADAARDMSVKANLVRLLAFRNATEPRPADSTRRWNVLYGCVKDCPPGVREAVLPSMLWNLGRWHADPEGATSAYLELARDLSDRGKARAVAAAIKALGAHPRYWALHLARLSALPAPVRHKAVKPLARALLDVMFGRKEMWRHTDQNGQLVTIEAVREQLERLLDMLTPGQRGAILLSITSAVTYVRWTWNAEVALGLLKQVRKLLEHHRLPGQQRHEIVIVTALARWVANARDATDIDAVYPPLLNAIEALPREARGGAVHELLRGTQRATAWRQQVWALYDTLPAADKTIH